MHVYLNLFLYLAPKLPKGKTTFCVCINRTQRNRKRIDSIMSIKFVFQEGSSRSKRKKLILPRLQACLPQAPCQPFAIQQPFVYDTRKILLGPRTHHRPKSNSKLLKKSNKQLLQYPPFFFFFFFWRHLHLAFEGGLF